MSKKEPKTNPTAPQQIMDRGCCSCRLESLVSVDERGQMVIPKAVRDKAGIVAGEKIGLVTYEMGGEFRFIALIKADRMSDMAKCMIDPIVRESR